MSAGKETRASLYEGKYASSPNPSGAYFNLRPGGMEGEVQVRVMDVTGKLLYAAKGSVQKEYRFGKGFKPGMYFVEVVQGDNRSTIKVVKQ